MVNWLKRAIFLLCFLFPQLAKAQDQCNDVLAAGMFNTSTAISQAERQRAARSYYCATGYSEARRNFDKSRSDNAGGGGNVGYGPFSLELDGNQSSSDKVTEEQYNLWKSQNCGDNSASEYESSFQYLAQSQVAPKVVQAWSDCMTKRQGLSCWIKPQSDYIVLVINFNVLGTAQARVRDSFLNHGKSSIDTAPVGKVFPDQYLLEAGKRAVAITRNAKSSVGGALTLGWSGQTDVCEFFAPAPPEPKSGSDYRGVTTLFVAEKFGCRITAQKCDNKKAVAPMPGNDLCRAEFVPGDMSASRHVSTGFSPRYGDRQKVILRVAMSPIPKGTERPPKNFLETWYFGKAVVTQIDNRASLDQRVAAQCNVEEEVWLKENPPQEMDECDAYGRC